MSLASYKDLNNKKKIYLQVLLKDYKQELKIFNFKLITLRKL